MLYESEAALSLTFLAFVHLEVIKILLYYHSATLRLENEPHCCQECPFARSYVKGGKTRKEHWASLGAR